MYRAIKAVTGGTGPTTDYTDWELNFVRANTTLMIGTGQPFPTLVAAWNYALNARVADGAYLHLYLSSAHGDFAEAFTAPFILDHGSGARMALLGDSLANDSLNFDGAGGFILDTGHSFNTLSGFAIVGSNPPATSAGVEATNQSTISSVGLSISGFPTGYLAAQGGRLTISSTVGGLQSFTNQGAYATSSGTIQMGSGFTLSGPGQNIFSSGLIADTSGTIIAPSVTISTCYDGIYAATGGSVNTSQAQVSTCYEGCDAYQGGSIYATRSTLTNEESCGCTAEYASTIIADNSTVDLCAVGFNSQTHSFISGVGASVSNNGTDLQAIVGGMINIFQGSYSTINSDGAPYGSYIETD